MAVPIITYGSETWTMTAQQTARIQTAEMNFLRPIAGYQRINKKQNREIRQELCTTHKRILNRWQGF